jgi:hypothetical protein
LPGEATVPATDPDDCATTGEASSTIADTAAMNPATGEMRLKLTCSDMGSSESEALQGQSGRPLNAFENCRSESRETRKAT